MAVCPACEAEHERVLASLAAARLALAACRDVAAARRNPDTTTIPAADSRAGETSKEAV